MPAAPKAARRKIARPCNGSAKYRVLSFPAGSASAVCLRQQPSITPVQHHLLDLSYGLGGIEIFRAGLGAVHDGVAAIKAKRIFKIVQALPGRLVAGVDDPAVGGQQCGGAPIAVALPPKAPARPGTTRPKKTGRGPVPPLPVPPSLQPVALRPPPRAGLPPR